ncbi:MAG: DNA mismatch repair protein MutS, partial [Clostridia bacterium]|nr:DNA mismatch repair protein MutS [Clostridia bacterium]
ESYGIEVAKLAGVPNDVIKRAREVLSDIQSGEMTASAPKTTPSASEEFNLFTQIEDSINSEVADRIKNTELNTLTPIEAMNLVWELKGMLNKKD